MKLTVAHKVIIGFGFITLLLLIASISALSSFRSITNANTQVNELAVPAQQQSNLAQIQLLQLARLTASGFTAEQSSDIQRYQQNFQQQQQQFGQLVQGFQQLAAGGSLQQTLQTAAAHASRLAADRRAREPPLRVPGGCVRVHRRARRRQAPRRAESWPEPGGWRHGGAPAGRPRGRGLRRSAADPLGSAGSPLPAATGPGQPDPG